MTFATVTSKGQTTIPKDVRVAANLKPAPGHHEGVGNESAYSAALMQ